MPVTVVYDDKSFEIEGSQTVEEAVKKVGVNTETIIVEKDGKLVSLDEELNGREKLKLINVVSGG